MCCAQLALSRAHAHRAHGLLRQLEWQILKQTSNHQQHANSSGFDLPCKPVAIRLKAPQSCRDTRLISWLTHEELLPHSRKATSAQQRLSLQCMLLYDLGAIWTQELVVLKIMTAIKAVHAEVCRPLATSPSCSGRPHEVRRSYGQHRSCQPFGHAKTTDL